MIAIDQYGHRYVIPGVHPGKELLSAFGRSHADRMFIDKPNGPPVHVGYIIAGHWLTLYRMVEKPI